MRVIKYWVIISYLNIVISRVIKYWVVISYLNIVIESYKVLSSYKLSKYSYWEL